jgi:hypothetical protein
VKAINYLVKILLIELIILCLLSSVRFVNQQSTLVLLIFSVLFISIGFQLNGTLNRKLLLLVMGNCVGFLWNLFFNAFATAAFISFGEVFNNIYIIAYPFLNSLWVISFWSLSLTFFHPLKEHKR